LESACFSPGAVRKTSKRLGLQTESSYRFERGVDPNGCLSSVDRLAELILAWSGGEVLQDSVDHYPQPRQAMEVSLRAATLSRVLGEEFSFSQMRDYLRALGIDCRESKEKHWICTIPTFRADLTREIDLVEEVARIHGYNRIPVHYPKLSLNEIPPVGPKPEENLRQTLVAWGFDEVMNYAFTSPQLLENFLPTIPKDLTLMNPIIEELSVLRPSLIPSLVKNLRDNFYWGNPMLKLFEISHVFASGARPEESVHLGLAILGPRRPLHFLEKPENGGFSELKGFVQALIGPELSFEIPPTEALSSYWHPKRVLGLKIQGKALGLMGELHPKVASKLGLSDPVGIAEINLDLFLTESKNRIQFKEISAFPSVERDLNLILDESVTHAEILRVLQELQDPWIRKIELFDIYRGAPLPERKKALTYRVEYGTRERTLTDEEVNQAREKLLALLNKKVGATLR